MKVIKEDNDLIEIDIKNSQFAIHAYWMKKDGLCQTEDGKKYYDLCRDGMLYDGLGESLNITRSRAKQLMMEVGFSSEGNNTSVKSKFRKKFPNAVAHIDGFKKEKGDYKMFSNELQHLEAEIIVDNLYPTIKELGIFCLTKHDSLIVKRADQDFVEKVVQSYFRHIGFECTLEIEEKVKIRCRNIEETLVSGDPDTQILVQTQNEYVSLADSSEVRNEGENKLFSHVAETVRNPGMSSNEIELINENTSQQEMKKKYTVDELLASKKKYEGTPIAEQPTKLQHLKIYQHKKMDDFETMIKGFQEQDAKEEATMNKIPRTDEEINEYAIQALKEDKIPLSKINIDYMVNEIKSAVKEIDNPAEVKKPYKFVNKYTN